MNENIPKEDFQRSLPPEYKAPVWVWWLAGILAIAGPLSLGGIWPGGSFFGGLAPTVFLLALYAEVPSERYATSERSYPSPLGVRRRGPYEWEAAWKRAFIAGAVCIGLAILSDWWGVRFGSE